MLFKIIPEPLEVDAENVTYTSARSNWDNDDYISRFIKYVLSIKIFKTVTDHLFTL